MFRNDVKNGPTYNAIATIEGSDIRSIEWRHFQWYDTIRYDTIESLTWTRMLSIQLNLAHVCTRVRCKRIYPGFEGHGTFQWRMSQKRCILETKLLQNANKKPYSGYGTLLISWWKNSDDMSRRSDTIPECDRRIRVFNAVHCSNWR